MLPVGVVLVYTVQAQAIIDPIKENK